MTDFVPAGEGAAGPDCTDIAAWGEASVIIPQYIAKVKVEPEEGYPEGACPPYYYSNAQIDNLLVTGVCGTEEVTDFVGKTVTVSGNITGGSKTFNIPHPSPNKKKMRLVHACLEGPENGVYFRGRVRNVTEIELPDYWKDLVDIDSITVSLTPIGAHQNVIVKRWDDEKVHLQSDGLPIDCFYQVYATRKDIEPLVIEQVE